MRTSSNFQKKGSLLYIKQANRKEVGTMLTYKGGNRVEKGTYWDVVSGRRIDVVGEAVLAGGGATTYVKVPAGVALLSMPIIGLIYVVLMPFIGMMAITTIASGRVLGGIADGIGKSLSFGWRPGNAYLSGKKRNKQGAK
jgi:hypothetical protein